MKKLLFSFFLLCLACGAQGQNISQTELTAFCERAIGDYFAKQRAEPEFVIQKDSSFPITKTDFNTFKIKYVANKELAYEYAKEKEGNEITIYDAYIKIKQDTVDIFIGWFSYKVLAKGDTLTIQQQPCFCSPKPTARLIFDKAKQTWTCLSKEVIFEMENRAFLERKKGKKYEPIHLKPLNLDKMEKNK